MKKSAKGFMIASFIMIAIAIICFAVAPIIAFTLKGHPETYSVTTALVAAINGLSGLLSFANVFATVLFVLAIVTVVIFITWLVLIIVRKKPNSVPALIFGLLVMFASLILFDVYVVTRSYGEGGDRSLISYLSDLAAAKAKDNDAAMFAPLALCYASLFFAALAFLFTFIESIVDMCTPGKVKRLYMDLASKDDNSDLDIESTEDMKDLLNEGLSGDANKKQAATNNGANPFIVQYFNTTGVPAQAPAQQNSLTAEDIRSIVRDELSRNSSVDLRGIMHKELPYEAPQPVMPQPIIINTPAPAPAPAPVAPAPAPAPAPVFDKDALREVIKEEIRAALNEIPTMDENEVRDLVRGGVKEELAGFKPVEVVEQLITVEEAKAEEAAPAPVSEPEPAPAPAPVVVAEPEPAPAPVNEEEKAKIVRIPFETRIVEADDVMKANFNELKADILAYGVKSRVSNSGDTFRLHTKTYVKITIAGNSLKLYFALDPKKYADSTFPIGDASNKGIYKEIPLVFKVKSGLSLRRAKQLVADVMAQDGLTQGEVVAHDYVSDIKADKKD